jgi:hypothetical protein
MFLLTEPAVSMERVVLGGVVADRDADVGVSDEVVSVVVDVLVVDAEDCEGEACEVDELDEGDELLPELDATTAWKLAALAGADTSRYSIGPAVRDVCVDVGAWAMRSLYCVSVVPGFTVIKPISTWGGGAVGVVAFGKKAMVAAAAAAKPPIPTTTRFAPVNTETIVASGPVRGVTRCFAGKRRSRFLRVPTDPPLSETSDR